MPIYEYECTACQHNFEITQKMVDAPLRDCPVCAEPQLRKKLSAPAFHLKGQGWYKTDFRDAKKAPAGDTKGDAKEGGSESSGAGDGKEAKPESKDAVSPARETSSDSKPAPPARSSTPDAA